MADHSGYCSFTGKMRFTEPMAQIKAQKSSEATGEHWSAYLCTVCYDYHIGHTPPYGKRSIARKEQKKRWRQKQREMTRRHGRKV